MGLSPLAPASRSSKLGMLQGHETLEVTCVTSQGLKRGVCLGSQLDSGVPNN